MLPGEVPTKIQRADGLPALYLSGNNFSNWPSESLSTDSQSPEDIDTGKECAYVMKLSHVIVMLTLQLLFFCRL